MGRARAAVGALLDAAVIAGSLLVLAWHVGIDPLIAAAAVGCLSVVGYPVLAAAVRGRLGDAGGESVAHTCVRVLVVVTAATVALTVSVTAGGSQAAVGVAAVLVVLVLTRLTWTLVEELRARGVLEDEVRAQAQALRAEARRDPVTGLGNRTLLREQADQDAVQLPQAALLLLDLDGFKEVNDALGHTTGDALLRQVGDRLRSCAPAGATVVRLGGDEFVLLLPDTDAAGAETIAERVLRQLRHPFVLDGTPVRARGSIGVVAGAPGSDLDEMLRHADLAMYEAKARGRDQARPFDPEMCTRAAHRLLVDTELREAVAQRQFTVYYQPIVDARCGEVTTVEALLRWDHPQRGVVPPFEFLPAAERNGLIVDIGEYVLRAACAQVAWWRQDCPSLTVAVNVSHRELVNPDYPAYVAAVLAETGLPPHALNLEITETVLAAEEQILEAIKALGALGLLFSIDDFGTGHSSLSRLRHLPVHRIKIDKSFISEIDGGDAPVLTSIIALAHSLGRTVVAEGVETPEQSGFLVTRGCDQLQGYLFSRPVAATHVLPVLFTARAFSGSEEPAHASEFADLMALVLDTGHPLAAVLPELLSELSARSGLESVFVTHVSGDRAQQVTLYAHNADPDAIRIEEGLAVDWCDTLCRRMIEDDVVCETAVSTRYGDVEAAANLGIETYITVPMYDESRVLRGTLCAASSRRRPVDSTAVGLMQLFAQALAERLHADARART